MDLRRLTAVFLGVAGLCLGLVGYMAEQSWLGIIGGIVALVVGIVAASVTGDNTEIRRIAAEAQAAADASRAEASKLRTELGESQGRLGSAQQTLADLMEQRPPAGSFDRKFDETGQIVPTPGTNPVDTKALTDTETTLFSEAYFRVALDARIASAAAISDRSPWRWSRSSTDRVGSAPRKRTRSRSLAPSVRRCAMPTRPVA